MQIAVVVILKKGSKILLLKRANTGWEDGKYSAVAGHLEPGQTPLGCAVNEVREEIGVKVDPADLSLVHVDVIAGKLMNLYFITEEWVGTPTNMEPQHCSELRWADMDDMPDQLAANGKETIAHILQENYYAEYH